MLKKPDIKITTEVDDELKQVVKDILGSRGEKTVVGHAADVIKDYMLTNAKPLEEE